MQTLNTKRFLLWNMVFAILLLVMFREFFFNQGTLLVTSDHLQSLGIRFVRDGFFLTQWAPARLGGIPALDATFSDAYHPFVFLHNVFHPARALGYKFILSIQVAFAGGLLLFSYLSKNYKIGVLIAFLYALSPQLFTLIYPGHDAKLYVISALPFAFYGYLQFLQQGKRWGLIILTLAIAWMIVGSHLQMAYFSLWGIGFHSLLINFKRWKDLKSAKNWGKQGLLAVALALALGLSMVQLYPPYQYTTTDSVRGSGDKTTLGHAVSWSIHPEEAMSIALPNFIGSLAKEEGRTSQPTYWGRNAFKLNSDAVGTMLWLVGFWGILALGIRNRESLFWISVITIAVVYALGIHTGIFPLFYNYLPGVKNFRAASMVLFWIPFALAYLGALGLPSYFESKSVWTKRLPITVVAVLSVIFVMLQLWPALASGPGVVFVIPAFVLINYALSQKDREKWSWKFDGHQWKSRGALSIIVWNFPLVVLALMFLNSGAIDADGISKYFRPLNTDIHGKVAMSVLPYLILCGVVIASFWFAQKQKLNNALWIMGAVAILELWILNTPFIQTVPLRRYVNPRHRVMREVKKAMPDAMNDYRVLTFSRDQAILPNAMPIFGLRNGAGFHDNEISTYREFRGGAGSAHYTQGGLQNNPYLDIAGIKYIVADQNSDTRIFENPTAFPRVKIFGSVEKVDDPIKSLRTRKDYASTLLFSEGELKNSEADVSGTAKIVKYPEGDDITVEVETNGAATLLLNENFHKYWKATVNDKDAPIVRAFGTFQAVSVPKGKSVVHFIYRSETVAFASKIVIASLIILLVFGLWCLLPQFNKPKAA